LSKLAAEDLSDFGMFGIVKETGVDDEGLLDFHKNFFSFPLYKDETSQFYTALGNRKLGLETWNPFRLYKGYKDLSKRMEEKKISGNLKGEGLVQGGAIVFDKELNVRAVYMEKTGYDFPNDDFLSVAKFLRDEEKATSGTSPEL